MGNPVETTVLDKRELIDKAINEMVNMYVTTKDFVIDQAPATLQQLLKWEMVSHMAIVAEAVAAVVLTLLFARWVAYCVDYEKKHKEEHFSDPFALTGLILSGGTAIATVVASIFSSIPTILQIWIAPNIYLIEYARDFLK